MYHAVLNVPQSGLVCWNQRAKRTNETSRQAGRDNNQSIYLDVYGSIANYC